MFFELDRVRAQQIIETKTNPVLFAQQSPVLQEAILVVAAKESKDLYNANQRAIGCGCNNCHKDAIQIKEWYL